MINILGPKKGARGSEKEEHKQQEKQVTASFLRLSKEITDLDVPDNAKIDFYNKEDITEFYVTVMPDNESIWHRGKYKFHFAIPLDYPHEPPKVKCLTKVNLTFTLKSQGFPS